MMKNNIQIMLWGSLAVAPFAIYAMDGRDIPPVPALISNSNTAPLAPSAGEQISVAQSTASITSVQTSDDDVFMSEEHLWQIVLAACTFFNAANS